ncbi:MAG: thiol peroxidase [Bryobacterales bacterium]|nr:thiol peroxidase [Bryobacterales bacterium]
MERKDAVTLKDKPLTVLGPELKAGDKAPDFELTDQRLSPVTLQDTSGRPRFFSVVPSLDTPICDAQTKRFDELAAKYPGMDFYTVSMDLPFAQKRWCTNFGADHIKMLSDHRTGSFGMAYGTLIKDQRLEARAIFIMDKDDVLQYVEYVKEIAYAANYDRAIEAVQNLAG